MAGEALKLVAPARGLPEEALKLLRDASMHAAVARERPEAALKLGRDAFKLAAAAREGPEAALKLGRDAFKLVAAAREGPEEASMRFGNGSAGSPRGPPGSLSGLRVREAEPLPEVSGSAFRRRRGAGAFAMQSAGAGRRCLTTIARCCPGNAPPLVNDAVRFARVFASLGRSGCCGGLRA